ncbi:MAG: hypothetical protein RBR30_10030 [Tenuifilaceae bacterium]|nr:hypothetical protein [Tenuifilaceae bacterium]
MTRPLRHRFDTPCLARQLADIRHSLLASAGRFFPLAAGQAMFRR